jgi:rod shape-determining protein MreC
VVRTGVTGLLRYDGRRFFVDHVPQGESVMVGDEMFTSGLGGTVPRGIPVGSVVAVRSSPSELFQAVELESPVDFSALRRVYVITRPGPWYARNFEAVVDTQATPPADAADPRAPGSNGAREESGR